MEKTLLNKIIAHYGQEEQVTKCVEECSELIKAICDYKLKASYSSPEQLKGLIYQVQEEIADVMIMAEQMALIFGEEEVKKLVDYKLSRTERRIRGMV